MMTRHQTPILRSLFPMLLLLLAVCFTPARAQDIKVIATVSETTVGDEEQVTYTLEVEGISFSNITAPEPPEAENLALLQVIPSTQQSMTFINGLQRQSTSFTWVYRPLRVGRAKIRPTSVTVQGRLYRTNEIEIDVVPQSQRPQRAQPSNQRPFSSLFGPPPSAARDNRISEQDIFIQAIPSANEAYQNEQLTVEYRLFFRPRESRLADSWDAEGFWREELPVEGRPIPRPTTRDGLRYNAITLKRVAVFPARSGNLRIDPLRIETEVLAMSTARDPFGRLFSAGNPFETVELASPAVEVRTKPLPPNPPDGFTGAVGRYAMTASVDRQEVQVGDAVKVRVQIRGQGNLALLEPPAFEAPGVFETYGPNVETVIDSTSQSVRGTKTFSYTLVPRSNGTFELPPVTFAYFNPNTEAYSTITSDPVAVRVFGTATIPATISTTGAGLPVDDISGLMTVATWRSHRQTPLHRSLWTYLALLVPLLTLGGVYAYHRHATRLATDRAFARSRKAHPLAKKHLKQARALLHAHTPEAYYEELERAVLGFIGNRMNIAERGLTRTELDRRLAEVNLGKDLRQALMDFLHTCDQVRFSPTRPTTSQMEASYDQAQRFIIAVDDALRRQAAAHDGAR